MTDLFPDLHGDIIIDTETHDPYLQTRGSGWAYGKDGGKIVGIGVLADNHRHYYPIGHTEGNYDPVKVKAYLSHQLTRDPRQRKVFANADYDVGWLRAEGIRLEGTPDDVLFQAALIDENRFNYGLDSLGKDYLGYGKDERALAEEAKRLGIKNTKNDNIKMHMARVRPEIAAIYCLGDCDVTRGLDRHFAPIISDQNLQEVLNLERDLIIPLIENRERGVCVDVVKTEEYQRQFLKEEENCRAEIRRLTGITIGSWDAAEELSKVFDRLEIPYGRTAKTNQPSITAGWLQSLDHPVAKLILTGRKTSNMRGTFLESAILDLQRNGRVHPTFNQLRRSADQGTEGVIGKDLKQSTKGTVSGRLSCSNPNFQQVPSPERDPHYGLIVRSLFVAEQGELWHGLDYSSQEPRVIVHFAEETNCRRAEAFADKFRSNPRTDFHEEVAELIRTVRPGFGRKPAKIIGLGIAYGMGGGKLALSLGLPYFEKTFMKGQTEISFLKAGPEAQELLDAFDEHAPFIKQLANKAQKAVKDKGYIVTPVGRRFRFPKDDAGKYMFLNKALNRLVQGTSADMTKLAMRELAREKIPFIGSVHDEIDFSSADPKQMKRAAEIMQTALPMRIPIVIDGGSGRSWGEASVPDIGGPNFARFMEGVNA